jgi:hypothetical protein
MSLDLRAIAERLTQFLGFYALMYSFRLLFIALAVLMQPAFPQQIEAIAVRFLDVALFGAIGIGVLRGVRGWRIGGAVLLGLLTFGNVVSPFLTAWYKAGYLTVDAILLAGICFVLVRPRLHGS